MYPCFHLRPTIPKKRPLISRPLLVVFILDNWRPKINSNFKICLQSRVLFKKNSKNVITSGLYFYNPMKIIHIIETVWTFSMLSDITKHRRRKLIYFVLVTSWVLVGNPSITCHFTSDLPVLTNTKSLVPPGN